VQRKEDDEAINYNCWVTKEWELVVYRGEIQAVKTTAGG
jgi:hypothetical protein